MTLLTYEQQLDLVDRKLAVKKTDGIFDTFKYHRRVMYDYLWDTEPNLLECRGHVYDNRNGKLINAAPTKTFNYLENGHWAKKCITTTVRVFKKINGYMACASLYKGEVVVSTTGTTNSTYAQWAKELILPDFQNEVFTNLYEVVVEQDPHIVKEELGLHYLGSRTNETGVYYPGGDYKVMSLDQAIKLAKTDRGEGFMLYDSQGNCCKLKTDYYVGKKKLMRSNEKAVNLMYNQPEQYKNVLTLLVHPVVDTLIKEVNVETWKATSEQDRRKFIENIIGE